MGNQKPVDMTEKVEELGSPAPEHHGKKKEMGGKKEKIQDKIKSAKYQKEELKSAKEETPAEEEGSEEQGQLKEEAASKKTVASKKVGKAKVRSKRYQTANALIDKNNRYDLDEAIELVKKTSLSKFDGNVEVHARILSKNGKPENIRGFVKYPHSIGKKLTVVILDEAKIEEIGKSAKIDFDFAIATPEMMPKVAKLAKILGPKGKMPNPKAGTVSANPEKTKAELEGGQTEYKTDKFGSVHQVIGKVSAQPKVLAENFKVLLAVLPKEKIDSLTLCATMGPGIKVQL